MKHNTFRSLFALCTLALLGSRSPAAAQDYTFLPNDTTIDSSLGYVVVIGYANMFDYDSMINGTSPVVTLPTGSDYYASMPFAFDVFNGSTFNVMTTAVHRIDSYDNSTVNYSGPNYAGYNGGAISTHGSSTAKIAGRCSYVDSLDNSTVNFSGVAHGVSTDGNGKLTLNSSSMDQFDSAGASTTTIIDAGIGAFTAHDHSLVHIQQGNIGIATQQGTYGHVFAMDYSTLDITGGNLGDIGGSLNAQGHSIINMSGGQVPGTLRGSQNSTINVSKSAYIDDLQIEDNGTMNISGGTIALSLTVSDTASVTISSGKLGFQSYPGYNFKAYNSSTVTVSGGTLLLGLYAYDSSRFNLFGKGLSSVLTDPNFLFDSRSFSVYTLAGKLSDGTDLTGTTLAVQNGTGAKLALYNDVLPATVSGTVQFEGVNDMNAIDRFVAVSNLTVDFFAPGSTTHTVPLFSRTATITRVGDNSPDGTLILNGVVPGTYDIGLKTDKSLRKILASVNVNGSIALPPTLLPGGDANNDNRIDLGDFGVLINAYSGNNNVYGSGYDPLADFNYDGLNDVGDFGILLNNFGTAGDK